MNKAQISFNNYRENVYITNNVLYKDTFSLLSFFFFEFQPHCNSRKCFSSLFLATLSPQKSVSRV